jgi:selenide, water dikinase
VRRLLETTEGGGCGCKLSPTQLGRLLEAVRPADGREPSGVFSGLAGLDDAAVVAPLGPAMAFTCDFFPPVVDDPWAWGRIAAANALSDVYAVGGSPVFALGILAWPREEVEGEELRAVLEGGLDALAEAGAALVGGHSIHDPAPKYGLAVLGTVDPERSLRIDGGRPGDVLVLTKPIGSGVVTTAAKREAAPAWVIEAATAVMSALNRDAAAVALDHGLRAATDVTGFGLLGHAAELASASGVAVELWAEEVPTIEGVAELLRVGLAPSGTARNLEAAAVEWAGTDVAVRELLADPQSSGGLLLCVPPAEVAAVLADLRARGCPAAAAVGRLRPGVPGTVTVPR